MASESALLLDHLPGRDTQRAASEQPDLGDLLGSVLGGGSGSEPGGGLGDMLGSIFGKR